MNDRERWIIYPLLFLALGAALRDKLLKQTRADQIVCSRMILVDTDGRAMAYLTGDELSFVPGGRGNGLIQVNAINAEGLYERNQPVAKAVGEQLWRPFMRMFAQLSTGRMPNLKVVPQPTPLPVQPGDAEDASPETDAPPPAAGPALTPPAQPTGEPSGAA